MIKATLAAVLLMEVVARPQKILNPQVESYVLYRVRGLMPLAAAKAAGYPPLPEVIDQIHADPVVDEWLVFYRMEVRKQSLLEGVKVEFTRDMAALMYLEAHRKAANATEEIKATDSLVKLYGLAAPEKHELKVTVTPDQVKDLSDDELLKLAGSDLILAPEDYARVPDEGGEDV